MNGNYLNIGRKMSVSLDPWSVDSCVLHVNRLVDQRFLGSCTEKGKTKHYKYVDYYSTHAGKFANNGTRWRLKYYTL